MSQRDEVIAYLTPILAETAGLEKVKLVKSIRSLGELGAKTPLIVKTDSYEKLPQAPMSKRLGHFTLILVSTKRDLDEAEDQLDDLLEILLPKLISSGIIWDTATQTAYDDTHLSYDISIRSIL